MAWNIETNFFYISSQKFEEDLRHYLESVKNEPIITQVHEVARFVRVKGYHLEDVAKFLLEKGFWWGMLLDIEQDFVM